MTATLERPAAQPDPAVEPLTADGAGTIPPSFDLPRTPRRRVWSRRLAGLIALATAGGITAAAVIRGSDSASGYRTATASLRSVEQVLHRVGIIEPVSAATVAFPVAGTVATVDVAAGASVTAGQQLATLDTTGMTVTLHEKEAALAQARLTVEEALAASDAAEDAEAEAAEAAADPASTEGDDLTIAIRAAQRFVLDAQRAVDDAIQTEARARADADAACESVTSDTMAACQNALDAVADAQAAVADAEVARSAVAGELDALLEQQAAMLARSAATSATTVAPGGGRAAGPDSSAAVPSAEKLIALQADVGAAELAVAVASHALKQATIVSPISGTVTSIGLAIGDTISAASEEAVFAIAGSGGYEVTTAVAVTDLPEIELGQKVTVTPDAGGTMTGTVVGIGLVSTSSAGGVTYPVTIALDRQHDGLTNGGTASVSIVTAAAQRVVAVPTSAVRARGTGHFVEVLASGLSEVNVTVGAIGPIWTEIRTGLAEGQQVVLADLSEPLPGSATSGSSRSSGSGPGEVRFAPGGGRGGPPQVFQVGG